MRVHTTRPRAARIGLTLAAAALTACTNSSPAPPAEKVDEDPVDVEALLARMTLPEKIGQMTQADLAAIEPAEVTELRIGSVLSGGNSDPEAGNSMEAWRAVYEAHQAASLETRLGIPILYGVDAVHGHSNVLGAVIFPHNIGLGATRDPDLVRRVAEVTAREMLATGTQWTFAPAVSVPRDERWGRTYEGFSEDPGLVSELGAAAVLGYQRGDLGHPLAVLATAKHYLGDGGTVPGSSVLNDSTGLDQGDMPLAEPEVRRIHLYPYIAAVEAGVGSIMPSYSSWNAVKMSGSRYLLTDVLKGELGFDGFLISDYNAIQQLDPDFKTAIAMSINAGMDMAMVPSDYRQYIDLLTELVEEGEVGLLTDDFSPRADRALAADFGCAAHRAVAREAVRKSLVLLKNDAGVLPLSSGAARLHVVGRAADDIGMQAGGWTIEWQGATGEVTEGGTTVLEALRRAAGAGTRVTFSEDGSGAEGADAAIVVIGEEPYAEMEGDLLDLTLSARDRTLVERVAATGVPTVVVLFSGRPLIINDALAAADAFVAAWLPGTEGDGVADVLFGEYPPTGRLSFTWPRSMDQIPMSVGDEVYDPLFPFGFGLTY